MPQLITIEVSEEVAEIVSLAKMLVAEAKSKKATGKGLVELDFNQGGITNKRLSLQWNCK